MRQLGRRFVDFVLRALTETAKVFLQGGASVKWSGENDTLAKKPPQKEAPLKTIRIE